MLRARTATVPYPDAAVVAAVDLALAVATPAQAGHVPLLHAPRGQAVWDSAHPTRLDPELVHTGR